MKVYAKKSYYNEGIWSAQGAASPSGIQAQGFENRSGAEGVNGMLLTENIKLHVHKILNTINAQVAISHST